MTLMLQGHLGEVVFVELPEENSSVSKEKSFGAVESVKATSEILSPISGEVIEVNKKLTDSPGLVWFKSQVTSQVTTTRRKHTDLPNLCCVDQLKPL